MFYGNTVQDTRSLFFTSWNKYCCQEPLTPLEQQIATVISQHPEYHYLFDAPQDYLKSPDFQQPHSPNPFLHMGLHLAIRDQVATNCPAGITALYEALLLKHHNTLEAEHKMMQNLEKCLWNAQRNQVVFDERVYLTGLRQQLDL